MSYQVIEKEESFKMGRGKFIPREYSRNFETLNEALEYIKSKIENPVANWEYAEINGLIGTKINRVRQANGEVTEVDFRSYAVKDLEAGKTYVLKAGYKLKELKA